LVWRQYRTSTAITGALIGLFAVLLVITGLQMASQFHATFGACLAANNCRFPSDDAGLGSGWLGAILEFSLPVAAILGMFLGAPAVAREVETGTAHFAWTQAITRRHWLTVKTGWLLLAAVAWGGAVGALVTWWSGPRNTVALNQFNPGTFHVPGIQPAAYPLFAMALGIAAGTLIRRVLPALGVTLGVFFAVRLMIMGWVRQHYMTPITSTFNVSQNVIAPPKGAIWMLGQGIRGPNGPLVIPAGGGPRQIVGDGFPVPRLPGARTPRAGQAHFGAPPPRPRHPRILAVLLLSPRRRVLAVPVHGGRHLRGAGRRADRGGVRGHQPPRRLASRSRRPAGSVLG